MNEPTSEPAGAPATTEAPAARPSPGALLRQARESASLGIEDLAGQVKLARSTLEALEADNFAALSEPVYIRGYYRKIAKLLPVSEAELIAAYDARSAPPKAAPTMKRIPLAGGVAAGTSRQARGQGIGIAVAVIVVLGVLVFLADREPPRRLSGEGQAPAVAPPAAVSPPAPDPAASAPPATAAPRAAPSTPPPAVTPPAATAPAPAAAPPAAPVQAPAAGREALVLELAESSFVRVEDSRGRTLAIGLVRAGERQSLEGRPPYTLFLGNARHVKVFYGGAPVDFSAHVNPQNDTARFTVP
jgi:cytoskeleton protein RodZ